LPIEHLVFMKLREAAPEARLQALYRDCESQLETIPGVVSISMGANISDEPSGFTHGLRIRFEDKDALDHFMPHPCHLSAGAQLQEMFADFLIVDYETERK
jgi:hypothetical protein